jgi:hypothetical protein
MSFPYQPLTGESEIRLLELLPGSDDAILKCQIIHTSLGEGPDYEALSYVWGETFETDQLLLNDHAFKVSTNLKMSLQHLRYKNKRRTMWIDAICINQNDTAERSQQVSKMHYIYKSARTVLAWLGEASDDSAEAMSLIQEVTVFMQSRTENTRCSITPESFVDFGMDVDSKNWAAFWRILSRPYWSRVWIIQELHATIDKNEINEKACLIGCGDNWLPFRSILQVYHFAIALNQSMTAFVTDYEKLPGDGLGYLEPFRSCQRYAANAAGFDLLEIFEESSSRSSGYHDFWRLLSTLLCGTQQFQASDPRDKVYALLGLIGDKSARLTVDYSWDLGQVFRETVRFCILEEKTLNIIQGNRKSSSGALPSWAPDWSNFRSSNLSWQAHLFNASKGIPANSPHFSNNSNILYVQAIILGNVKQVIGLFEDIKEMNAAEIGEHFERMDASLEEYRESLSPTQRESVWRALILDKEYKGKSPVSPAPDDFGHMYEVYFNRADVPADYKPDLPEDSRRMDYIYSFTTSMQGAIFGRALLGTDKGNTGMGPFQTLPGDLVVVLVGASMCSVLRPYGDHYKLLGEAYVHGYMNGEALDVDDTGNVINAQVIGIC